MTRQHALLLRAALGPAPAALAAWREWQQAASTDHLEAASQWLLPLLYWNLRQAGAPEVELQRYANVYRHTWYKNNLLLQASRPALLALAQPARRPLLLAGAALALGHYPALGARPIEAVRLAVTGLEAGEVAERLGALGWRACAGGGPWGQMFQDRSGWQLSVLTILFGRQRDDAAWANAPSRRWRGFEWRLLGLDDQWVHLLANRAGWDGRSRLLWVADAVRLAREAPWTAGARRAETVGMGRAAREGAELLGAWLAEAGL